MKNKFYELLILVDLKLLKFDNFLAQRKKQEIYILYFVPLLIFGYLSFTFFVPGAMAYLQKSEKELRNAEAQIQIYRSKLKSVRDGILILKVLETRNNEMKRDIEKINQDNYVTEGKIDIELKEIKHNSITWSQYLFDITKKATKRAVKLDYFKNKINPKLEYGVFSKIIDIDINATGLYTGVMDFIDTLERDQRLVEITDLNMKIRDKFTFEVHLDIWGTK